MMSGLPTSAGAPPARRYSLYQNKVSWHLSLCDDAWFERTIVPSG